MQGPGLGLKRINSDTVAGGQVNKWQDRRPSPELGYTRGEFQHTMRWMEMHFMHPGGRGAQAIPGRMVWGKPIQARRDLKSRPRHLLLGRGDSSTGSRKEGRPPELFDAGCEFPRTGRRMKMLLCTQGEGGGAQGFLTQGASGGPPLNWGPLFTFAPPQPPRGGGSPSPVVCCWMAAIIRSMVASAARPHLWCTQAQR